MASNMSSCVSYRNHNFCKTGHKSGKGFLKKVQELLRKRNQATLFRLDAPTESKGNCFPYALMQNLHLPHIYCTLTEEKKCLIENYHDLRVAIIRFVQNIEMDSQYFAPIDEGRTQNALMQIEDNSLPTWEEKLSTMRFDGNFLMINLSSFQHSF